MRLEQVRERLLKQRRMQEEQAQGGDWGSKQTSCTYLNIYTVIYTSYTYTFLNVHNVLHIRIYIYTCVCLYVYLYTYTQLQKRVYVLFKYNVPTSSLRRTDLVFAEDPGVYVVCVNKFTEKCSLFENNADVQMHMHMYTYICTQSKVQVYSEARRSRCSERSRSFTSCWELLMMCSRCIGCYVRLTFRLKGRTGVVLNSGDFFSVPVQVAYLSTLQGSSESGCPAWCGCGLVATSALHYCSLNPMERRSARRQGGMAARPQLCPSTLPELTFKTELQLLSTECFEGFCSHRAEPCLLPSRPALQNPQAFGIWGPKRTIASGSPLILGLWTRMEDPYVFLVVGGPRVVQSETQSCSVWNFKLPTSWGLPMSHGQNAFYEA